MSKISFIIPSHNCAVWLPHAVLSLQQQTEKDIEIIVINDGSSDSTSDYLKWLANNESRSVIHEWRESRGRCAARNKGISLASSDIIAVLDADDISYPERAERTIKKLANADLVYGASDIIGPLGDRQGLIPADVFNRPKALETLENRIVHSTMACKKDLALSIPYSDDKEISILGIDDWDFQIRAAMSGAKFDFIPQTIGAYRIRQSGISQTRDNGRVKLKKHDVIKSLLAVA